MWGFYCSLPQVENSQREGPARYRKLHVWEPRPTSTGSHRVHVQPGGEQGGNAWACPACLCAPASARSCPSLWHLWGFFRFKSGLWLTAMTGWSWWCCCVVRMMRRFRLQQQEPWPCLQQHKRNSVQRWLKWWDRNSGCGQGGCALQGRLRCEKVSPKEYAIYWPDTEEPREAGTWVCMLFVHFDK